MASDLTTFQLNVKNFPGEIFLGLIALVEPCEPAGCLVMPMFIIIILSSL